MRRRRRRRFRRRRNPSAKALARIALRKVNNLTSQIEFKHHTVTEAGSNMTDAGIVHCMSMIAVGDTEEHRDGKKISVRQWRVKMMITNDEAGDTLKNFRIILFQDNQQAGTDPAPGDLLVAQTATSETLYNGRIRFKILYDKSFGMRNNVSPPRYFEYFKRFKNLRVKYLGDDALEASQGPGSLFIYYYSTQNAANFPTIYLSSEIHFVDI